MDLKLMMRLAALGRYADRHAAKDCSDGMCGAYDCRSCGSRYKEEPEDQEEPEEEEDLGEDSPRERALDHLYERYLRMVPEDKRSKLTLSTYIQANLEAAIENIESGMVPKGDGTYL